MIITYPFDSRQNNFELVVSLKNNQASGRLYWDDGESIYSFENGEYQINTYNYASVMNIDFVKIPISFLFKLFACVFIGRFECDGFPRPKLAWNRAKARFD